MFRSGRAAIAFCVALSLGGTAPAGPVRLRTPAASPYEVPIAVKRLFLQAQLQYRAGHYEPALKKISLALAKAPDYVEGHHLYQDVRTALGDTEGVIARYRARLKQKPDDALSHYLLGRVVTDLKEKEALFRRAAALDPKFPWPHYGLGYLYERQKRWAESEEAFKRAIALDPSEAAFHHGLGFCYLQQGRNGEAEKAFRKALECDADYVDSLINLSVVALRRQEYAHAEAWCRKALAVDKDNPWAQNNLGKACFWQGKNAAALRAYQAAASSRRYDTPEVAYVNMGFVYRRQNKPEQAAAAFRRAIELQPAFAYAHVLLAYVLYDQKKYADAWAEVAKAEKLGYRVHRRFIEALEKAAPRPPGQGAAPPAE